MNGIVGREMIAYGLIGLMLLAGLVIGRVALDRRRRTRLRMRGIKQYEH